MIIKIYLEQNDFKIHLEQKYHLNFQWKSWSNCIRTRTRTYTRIVWVRVQVQYF